jgi:hypothetical protein
LSESLVDTVELLEKLLLYLHRIEPHIWRPELMAPLGVDFIFNQGSDLFRTPLTWDLSSILACFYKLLEEDVVHLLSLPIYCAPEDQISEILRETDSDLFKKTAQFH